eukprot:760057-Hanusia_phi.AAC.1
MQGCDSISTPKLLSRSQIPPPFPPSNKLPLTTVCPLHSSFPESISLCFRYRHSPGEDCLGKAVSCEPALDKPRAIVHYQRRLAHCVTHLSRTTYPLYPRTQWGLTHHPTMALCFCDALTTPLVLDSCVRSNIICG